MFHVVITTTSEAGSSSSSQARAKRAHRRLTRRVPDSDDEYEVVTETEVVEVPTGSTGSNDTQKETASNDKGKGKELTLQENSVSNDKNPKGKQPISNDDSVPSSPKPDIDMHDAPEIPVNRLHNKAAAASSVSSESESRERQSSGSQSQNGSNSTHSQASQSSSSSNAEDILRSLDLSPAEFSYANSLLLQQVATFRDPVDWIPRRNQLEILGKNIHAHGYDSQVCAAYRAAGKLATELLNQRWLVHQLLRKESFMNVSAYHHARVQYELAGDYEQRVGFDDPSERQEREQYYSMEMEAARLNIEQIESRFNELEVEIRRLACVRNELLVLGGEKNWWTIHPNHDMDYVIILKALTTGRGSETSGGSQSNHSETSSSESDEHSTTGTSVDLDDFNYIISPPISECNWLPEFKFTIDAE